MLTISKSALGEEPVDLGKILLQVFLGQFFHAHGIKGGKAGSICHKPAVIQLKQFHMTGGMLAAGDFFAHIPYLQTKTAVDPVEDTGLSDGRVSSKGTDLACKQIFDLCHTFTGNSTGPHYGEAGLLIGIVQVNAVMQIGFVQQNDGLNPLIKRNHRYLINQIRIGDRRCLRGKDHQLVDIGNGRTDQTVATGQAFHNITAGVGDSKSYIFTCRQNTALVFQFGTGTAAQNLAFTGYIIVAANSFDDHTLFFNFH